MARFILSPLALLALLAALVTVVTGWEQVCYEDPYLDLLFLEHHTPAEQYCSIHHPQPTVTVTAEREKRWWDGRPDDRFRGEWDKHRPTNTVEVWESCSKKGGDFVKTLCHCIDHAKTVTVSQPISCIHTLYERSPLTQDPPGYSYQTPSSYHDPHSQAHNSNVEEDDERVSSQDNSQEPW